MNLSMTDLASLILSNSIGQNTGGGGDDLHNKAERAIYPEGLYTEVMFDEYTPNLLVPMFENIFEVCLRVNVLYRNYQWHMQKKQRNPEPKQGEIPGANLVIPQYVTVKLENDSLTNKIIAPFFGHRSAMQFINKVFDGGSKMVRDGLIGVKSDPIFQKTDNFLRTFDVDGYKPFAEYKKAARTGGSILSYLSHVLLGYNGNIFQNHMKNY